MSDIGRKDLSTQVKDDITPNKSKSSVEQLTQGVTGAVDSVLGAITPDSNKSTTQSTYDKTRNQKDGGPLGSITNSLGLGGK